MSSIKPSARVLDATCGYRGIWTTKEDNRVLWIDIEPELDVKPDIILDCVNTGFEDKRFHTIIFDPPHSFGREKNTGFHQTPSKKLMKEKWGSQGSYYGFDKFPTKRALLAFINKAQKEFSRILMDDGILWFKWTEIHSSWDAIKPFFSDWIEMLKFEVAFQGRTKGDRTFWIALMKNPNSKQTDNESQEKHRRRT